MMHLRYIVIAYEVFHWLRKYNHQKERAMTIKLNIHKAYNNVDCGFLLVFVEKMEFNTTWIK